MEEESKNLNEISKKLGIDDRKIISKASEYLRLLKVKSNTLNINEYAKIVICLDVAATNANNATFNPVRKYNLLTFLLLIPLYLTTGHSSYIAKISKSKIS